MCLVYTRINVYECIVGGLKFWPEQSLCYFFILVSIGIWRIKGDRKTGTKLLIFRYKLLEKAVCVCPLDLCTDRNISIRNRRPRIQALCRIHRVWIENWENVSGIK
jgi:hypothetical protein